MSRETTTFNSMSGHDDDAAEEVVMGISFSRISGAAIRRVYAKRFSAPLEPWESDGTDQTHQIVEEIIDDHERGVLQSMTLPPATRYGLWKAGRFTPDDQRETT